MEDYDEEEPEEIEPKKKGFFEKLGDSLSNIDWNAPFIMGGSKKEQVEIMKAYAEGKAPKHIHLGSELHLTKNYIIIDKKSGKNILNIDPDKVKIVEVK